MFDSLETSSVEFPFDCSGSVCPFSVVALPEFSGFVEVSSFDSSFSGLFVSSTEVVESLGLLDTSPVFSLDVSGDTFSEFAVDSSAD
ncbi:Uncharacterised protein [Streptococcus pneumoniae]|nr:Uncharacterised protein [Streptococcus pneumoniae]